MDLIETMGELSNGPIPDPHVLVEKSPFQILAERLEVDENVKKEHILG